MKKYLAWLAAFCGFSAFAAMPEVSNVRLEQDSLHRVTVTYDLAVADGIVTVEFMTNSVPIGEFNLWQLKGDVNKLVAKGSNRKIVWKPHKTMVECGVVNAEFTCKVKAWSKEVPPPYAVFDLDGSKKAAYFNSEDALPGGITSRVYRTDKMVFRRIPAACRTFRAGAQKTAAGYSRAEAIRYVTLTNDFYLGVFPVTQGQYMKIMGAGATNPSANANQENAELTPVNMLSGGSLGFPYADRTDPADVSVPSGSVFGKARSLMGITTVYAPTYSEWEFACRAGSNDDVYGGYSIDEVAWHAGNSGGVLQPVGLKKANAWGLYDMLGNVCERVRDSADMPAESMLSIAPYYGTGTWGSHQMVMGGAFSAASENLRASAYAKGSGGGYNSNGAWEARYFSYANETFGVRFYIPLQ